jgi:hypothetical protein
MDPGERAQRSEPRERSEPAKRRASERVGESEGQSPSDRVDELRRQLRSLGYLDAGVDRFVLGPVGGRQTPSALAALAALRVGLLGGVLLGPAAAVGVGARLPGLVSGVRDAAVIALYLAVVFFLGASALSFLISTTIALVARSGGERFPRRASRASRIGGWIIAGVSLLYLTLWWRNANAGFGWSAPVWTAFALIVAVAISLLIGHAQRIATVAVLAAAAGPSALLPPVGARSWRVVLGGGALAFAGAAALLVSTASVESASGPDHPPLTVVSRGAALRVVAIDGFDAAMYDAFASELNARFLGRRMRLAAQDGSDPARAWTTIATGQPPAVHGVLGIETRRVAGVQGSVAASGGTIPRAIRAATDLVRLTRPSVASRDERRSKTVWEVAEEAGLRTAVVNWWATWPAPPGNGIVISDRAVLRLEQGGELDAEIAPASLYQPLRAAWPALRERARVLASRFDSAPDAASAAILKRSAELDATIIGILDALPGPARDLDLVYLPGLDIAQHALLAAPQGAASTPSAVAARLDALRGYYPFLQEVTRGLLAPSERVKVVVITQPGRVQGRAEGVMAAYNALDRFGDMRPGVRNEGAARAEDIAPTLLNGLGVPLSRELAGTPAPIVLGSLLPRYVDTYGRPGAAPASRQGRPLDQEMIDRLRSLGYVK